MARQRQQHVQGLGNELAAAKKDLQRA